MIGFGGVGIDWLDVAVSRGRQAVVARWRGARQSVEVASGRWTSPLVHWRVSEAVPLSKPVAISRIDRSRSSGLAWTIELCKDRGSFVSVRQRRVEGATRLRLWRG